ncbi:MAG: DegV family protein [Clostridia bacterium]|nr:DegV family protein [Clostridia bacterium]
MAVVTDSVADLPASLYRENGITVVPLSVIFGDEIFHDQIDITSEQFFSRLRTAKTMPSTSQPSPAEFIEVYDRLIREYDYVFSVHASAKLSGTFQSATIARDTLESGKIEVIDTANASAAEGFAALAGARAVKAGLDPARVREAIHSSIASTRILFTVDTLEFLQRNGRIGKASSLLGTLLAIKPIISVADGVVTPVEKVRGSGRVLPRVLELMEESMGGAPQPIRVAVLHADAEERAAQWSEGIRLRFECAELFTAQIGPVVGTHAGPGTLGVVWRPYEV